MAAVCAVALAPAGAASASSAPKASGGLKSSTHTRDVTMSVGATLTVSVRTCPGCSVTAKIVRAPSPAILVIEPKRSASSYSFRAVAPGTTSFRLAEHARGRRPATWVYMVRVTGS
jgi:hypothetical protein